MSAAVRNGTLAEALHEVLVEARRDARDVHAKDTTP